MHVIVVCSVLSVNTGTESKVPIPNFLGTEFLQEPIGTDLLRNRICMGTEELNRSVRYYRMPKVSDSRDPWLDDRSEERPIWHQESSQGKRLCFDAHPRVLAETAEDELGEVAEEEPPGVEA